MGCDRVGMPDRYADAVRARREELRVERALLDGSHRTELRNELALSRIAAAESATAALADLAREARIRIDAGAGEIGAGEVEAGEVGVGEVPAQVAGALVAVAERVHSGLAVELAPAVRRIATRRGVPVPAGWPPLPAPRFIAPEQRVEPIRRGRSLIAGAAEGVAVWRLLLLPLAVLPLLGLPALGGLRFAPLAAGLALAAIALTIRSGRAALRRAALRRCVEEMITSARSTIDADLGRMLLEIDRAIGVDLDTAVHRRRAAVDAQLRALAADRPLGVAGG